MLVEGFICATFFSYALFRILTSPLCNLLKTVVTKIHSKGLAASSFASLCLRTHPLLTLIMRSKCNFVVDLASARGLLDARFVIIECTSCAVA